MGLISNLMGNTAQEKKVVTAEAMGTGLVVMTLNGADRFLQELQAQVNKAGIEIPADKSLKAALEILALELVCTTVCIVRAFGETGYKAATVLSDETLQAVAENLGLKGVDITEFVQGASTLLDARYREYSKEIWDLGQGRDEGDVTFYHLGGKILKNILDLSTEQEALRYLLLSMKCSIHVIACLASFDPIEQQFTLSGT